jgi:hypothetical protein
MEACWRTSAGLTLIRLSILFAAIIGRVIVTHLLDEHGPVEALIAEDRTPRDCPHLAMRPPDMGHPNVWAAPVGAAPADELGGFGWSLVKKGGLEFVFDYGAAFHDPEDALQLGDVGERVVADGDDVGEFAVLEGADAILPAEELG